MPSAVAPQPRPSTIFPAMASRIEPATLGSAIPRRRLFLAHAWEKISDSFDTVMVMKRGSYWAYEFGLEHMKIASDSCSDVARRRRERDKDKVKDIVIKTGWRLEGLG